LLSNTINNTSLFIYMRWQSHRISRDGGDVRVYYLRGCVLLFFPNTDVTLHRDQRTTVTFSDEVVFFFLMINNNNNKRAWHSYRLDRERKKDLLVNNNMICAAQGRKPVHGMRRTDNIFTSHRARNCVHTRI
jgi:hypothetical protein